MPSGDLERVFAALRSSGCRYLVVGGVAVVLHGHPRFTADLDLVLALDSHNVDAAIEALGSLGYRPRAPVAFSALADPEARRRFAEEKRMTVFSLWSPELPATEVDVFVTLPFDFEAAYARALRADLGSLVVTVASLTDLIEMKQRAARPVDLEDVRALRQLAAGDGGSGDE